MRSRTTLNAFLLLAVLGGAYYGWSVKGGAGLAFAVVVAAPVIGLIAAPMVMGLLGRSLHAAKAIALADFEGRNYAYKDRRLSVQEDIAGDRWIRVDDIRKVLTGLPRDAVLAKLSPDDVGLIEGDLYFSAQGLHAYLAKSQDDRSIRFRNWVQREIIVSAQLARERQPHRTVVHDEGGPAKSIGPARS